jgi:hypothetical protein
MYALGLLLTFTGLTVRALDAKRVTVGELEHTLAVAHRLSDAGAARQLSDLELTERLSSPKLAMLSAELPGKKSKAALMAVADASVFLEPPADEVPQTALPDLAEQSRVMSLATDYLNKILPKLPNFYAKRFTTSFAEVWTPKHKNDTHKRGPLKPTGKFKATVYYRTGKEVVLAEGANEQGLVTLGTFGPILRTITLDAARSATTKWRRWENGTNGPMAVFGFEVPQTESHYKISGIGELGTLGPTAYHGEIGIDPASGTILRLALEADPALGSPTHRADVMVEYGSVEIGGKTYTCPARSVSYSAKTMVVLPGLEVGKREAVRLNDVVFTDYHVFRAEMRIMP